MLMALGNFYLRRTFSVSMSCNANASGSMAAIRWPKDEIPNNLWDQAMILSRLLVRFIRNTALASVNLLMILQRWQIKDLGVFSQMWRWDRTCYWSHTRSCPWTYKFGVQFSRKFFVIRLATSSIVLEGSNWRIVLTVWPSYFVLNWNTPSAPQSRIAL